MIIYICRISFLKVWVFCDVVFLIDYCLLFYNNSLLKILDTAIASNNAFCNHSMVTVHTNPIHCTAEGATYYTLYASVLVSWQYHHFPTSCTNCHHVKLYTTSKLFEKVLHQIQSSVGFLNNCLLYTSRCV